MNTSPFQIFSDGPTLPKAWHSAVVAIGNFDGMHLGHQALFDVAKAQARRLHRPWGIVTFEPHPRLFFQPQQPLFRITPFPLKARLAKACGADFMLCLNFDQALANSSPHDFVLQHLVENLRVAHVVTGYDFHFGKARSGTPQTLAEMGGRFGFGVSIVEQVADEDHHAPYASRRIREALLQGNMQQAAHGLGYNWAVMGHVVKGDQRGRTLGFPTANLALPPEQSPLPGIYAVTVQNLTHPEMGLKHAAAYFGTRPSFNSPRTFLESYIFDFTGDLYGQELLISFVAKLRDDQKFADIAKLVQQMHQDCAQARTVLAAAQAAAHAGASPLSTLQWQARL